MRPILNSFLAGFRLVSVAGTVLFLAGWSGCSTGQETGETNPCKTGGRVTAAQISALLSGTKAAHSRVLSYSDYLYNRVSSYPALMGITSERTGGLCKNIDKFTEDQKRGFWSKVVLALAKSESDFSRQSVGEDTSHTARGILQLNQASVGQYGCHLGGDESSLDCALKILSNNVTSRQGLLDRREYYKEEYLVKRIWKTNKRGKRYSVDITKWKMPSDAWKDPGHQQYFSTLMPNYHAKFLNGHVVSPFSKRFIGEFMRSTPECIVDRSLR